MIIRVTNWEGIERGAPVRVKGQPRSARFRFEAFCMSGNKAWIEVHEGGSISPVPLSFPADLVSVDTRGERPKRWWRKKESDVR